MVALLAGCSSRPPMRPVNEINEPVFYPLDYLAAEALAGAVYARDSSQAGFEPGVLFEPRLTFEKNVSPRTGFSFWPFYWNLLLTDHPLDAGGNTEVGEPNLAAHGGLNSLGYSSREGWLLGAALGLRGKYLIDDRLFLRANLVLEASDLTAPGKYLGSLESGLGYQMTPMHSLLLSHSLRIHQADSGRRYLRHGLEFSDGDVGNEFRAGHKAYLTPSHILGPEIGYGFRNFGIARSGYFLLGIKYRYAVD